MSRSFIIVFQFRITLLLLKAMFDPVTFSERSVFLHVVCICQNIKIVVYSIEYYVLALSSDFWLPELIL